MGRKLALTLAGGFCGTIARFLLSAPLLWLASGAPGARQHLPYDILTINLVGALLIGLLYGATDGLSAPWTDVRVALGTGVLGGFTTFSSLMVGTDTLAQSDHPTLAMIYLAVSLILGVAFAQAGHLLGGVAVRRWPASLTVAAGGVWNVPKIGRSSADWRLEETDDLDEGGDVERETEERAG